MNATLSRSLAALMLLSTAVLAEDSSPASPMAKSFEATTIAGKKVKFPDDFKGKTVMLDFWAMWCGPCLREVPNLAKVYADLNAKGFEVLGVSLDADDKKLPEFTKGKSMNWAQVCDGRDGPIAKLYSIRSIPSCFLVDGTTGKVIANTKELRGDALRPTVEKALGLKPSNIPAVAAPPSESKKGPPPPPDPLLEIAAKAVKSGEFLSDKAVAEQLKKPQPGTITLPKGSTQIHSSKAVARLARAAHLRAGWFFHCTKCDHWHLNEAGAYAIADDVVVTAHHVMAKPDSLKEGWFIVTDEQNKIYTTKAILGSDEVADTAIIRVSGEGLKPLPLAAQVELGEQAYCFSDPLGYRGYFSAGIVNRFYYPDASRKPNSQVMNVSTDWAQGSSGSSIIDECGNIIGHVARIQTFNSNRDKNGAPGPGTTLVMHQAIPSPVVLSLVKSINASASK